ncbi:protein of unknown function [Prevotella sp. tc2-28]|uniref:DUF4494 domain-containing protein n=1 Tax=Prevotella sp. tc2-28 TaxID=1761888 RepID=UPI00089D4FC9|nr:DUF4494 domain-containing protein [Prevotella sp. tc2-28]SEA79832.1 protein of unknown function [Prevotella sp. tc2-28]
MRSKTATWFVCGIRYEKTLEDGTQKKVTEQYVIDALSFTEAEERITEEMSAYISGEYEVKTCAFAPFREIFFSGDDNADKWYKAKIDFISFDEKSGKEKRSHNYYLVQAGSIGSALSNIDFVMSGTMLDYVVMSIQETPVVDVFEYKVKPDDGGEQTEA